MAAVTVTFDQPAYAPGDTIRMTLTLTDVTTPGPQPHQVSGYAVVGDQRVTFEGVFTVQPNAPTADNWIITGDGGYTWDSVAVDPTTAVFETTA